MVYMTYYSMNLDDPNAESINEWYNKQSDVVKGFFEAIGFKNLQNIRHS